MTMASPTDSTENPESTPEGGNADNGNDDGLGTQCTVEEVGPCRRRIKAEVPSVKVEEELDRNYRELISSVQIRGFRRGHVPRRLLEKRYGEEIEGDVKDTLLGMSFAEVVKGQDLKVLGKPKFDNIAFQKGEPLRYEVEVEVRPEFELGAYSGVEADSPELPAVKPEEVDHQIDHLREQFAELTAVSIEEAGPKDYYFGSYVLRRDGLKVHSEDEARFRPDTDRVDVFPVSDLAQVVQARQGATFTVQTKVPAEYKEEVLRGSDVELEFKIEDTKRVQLPPADDELAKHFGVDTIAALRSRIEKQIDLRHRRTWENKVEQLLADKVTEGVQFELPQGLLEEQTKMAKLRRELALIQEGRPREEIEAEVKKLEEAGAGEEIRRDFKRFFVLEKIADEEKIFATEDEVNLRVMMLAQAYGRAHQELYEELEENGRIESVRVDIRHAKVLRFLREKAKLTGAVPAPLVPEEDASSETVAAAMTPPEESSPDSPSEGERPSESGEQGRE